MKNLFKKDYLNLLYLIVLGSITSFSLPPYNYFIINFFTFSLLFIFLIKKKNILKKKIQYFKYGWLFGFGYFFSSLYWITISLTFDPNFKILIPISLILVPSFLAIFYGLSLYIFSFFLKKNTISLILIFSVLFGILEFIRGNILTGFPWNLFVFSFSKNLDFLQILSVLGTYGLNMMCVTFFLIPTIFILRKSKSEIFFGTFFIFIGIFFIIFGNKILNNNDLYFEKRSDYVIKIISSKISIDRFYNDLDEMNIIKNLINLSKPDPKVPTVFIWPEGILTSTNLDNIENYKKLFENNFSDKHLIVLGINDSINDDNGVFKIYNSLVIVDNNLEVKSLYYKNNLVPFGEFLPLENYLRKIGLKTITNNYQSFNSGKSRDVIKIKNQYFEIRFLPLICYEIIYSGKLNSNSKIDFIINISEDGWFGNSIGPSQHFSHSVFRAIEEGKNIIRSSNNGISAFINRKGQIIKKVESTQGGVIKISNFPEVNETIFSRNGNNIFFYLLIIYISFIFFINRKGKK